MKKNVSDKFKKIDDDLPSVKKQYTESTVTQTSKSSQLASIGPSIQFKGEQIGRAHV